MDLIILSFQYLDIVYNINIWRNLMKVLIMGSGGVGGYYGSVLFKNGHDVKFIARGEHLKNINSNGLIVESVTSGNYTISVDAFSKVPTDFHPEVIFFTVKAYDNHQAIRTISQYLSEETTLVTLQNGVGSADLLRQKFPLNNIITGVTYVDSFVSHPGHIIEQGGPCNIILGNQFDPEDKTVSLLHKILTQSKINISVSPNIQIEVWNKLIYICALSGMMCITRSSMDSILNHHETFEMTREIIQEVYNVSNAMNLDLEKNIVNSTMNQLKKNSRNIQSSMQTDLFKGKKIEVDYLNGAVFKFGKKYGIKTPINEYIFRSLSLHNA
ncbi:MAG: 2-dehydropantoate 2-reductase [SAR202 cluster bacterium]|nr:2-dehydropantoate 2-reductase [SAR202 cluster bacterium]|tara:strand:- start:38621 stop:39601 length:981 start_codon:yes stop_codon:yes gene_type:complete